jgi:hypothetical protein
LRHELLSLNYNDNKIGERNIIVFKYSAFSSSNTCYVCLKDAFKKAKSVYNDPNVSMAPTPMGEIPTIKDKNPKYPAISNNIEFRFLFYPNRNVIKSSNFKQFTVNIQ